MFYFESTISGKANNLARDGAFYICTVMWAN